MMQEKEKSITVQEKKEQRTSYPPREGEQFRPRVIVKFRDYVELPYEDRAEEYIRKFQLGPWDQLVKEFPGISLRRLYTVLSTEGIRALVDKAIELDQTYRPPNFLTYFVIDCPSDIGDEALAKALSSWKIVQEAYIDQPAEDPTVNASDDPRSANQGYLNAAPGGINARYAWLSAGGDGAGQRIIDLEQGWTLNHEDLVAHGASILFGTLVNTSRFHGTAVLGEITASDNTVGVVGIVPNVASINVVSHSGSTSNIPNGILATIIQLDFGNVLLLEVQINLLPCETVPACFDAIRLATALGIVVVEAGGNGATDLDTFTDASGRQVLNRGSVDFKDSGAIMVGAASSTVPHSRLNFSNLGSRIDCYAWGENVDTSASDTSGSTTLYTSTFNGTSSASPIITGAALAVQGEAQANLGFRFSPKRLRAILSNPATGTLSSNPAVDRIGVMPDLQSIISTMLQLAPDIFIRDFVGDIGDPHTGAVSASPDIILRPAPVANPQVTLGAGSGTENSNTLGDQAETGHDDYIYVRVLNRGNRAATNVLATVYWSPVATLVTPNLWTLVGSITIPSVPSGNILTVSDAIVWPSAAIPAPGHFCFVGLINSVDDPAPSPTDFLNWNNFVSFIRENNNVTWRNFNVVSSSPSPGGDPADYVELPFIFPGAPDIARRMQLEVVARLPEGAKALLEVPLYLLDAMQERSPFVKVDEKRGVALLPINPHGRHLFGEVLLPALSQAKLKLLVHIPEDERKHAYEVFVRQLYEHQEVGRVTWSLHTLGISNPV